MMSIEYYKPPGTRKTYYFPKQSLFAEKEYLSAEDLAEIITNSDKPVGFSEILDIAILEYPVTGNVLPMQVCVSEKRNIFCKITLVFDHELRSKGDLVRLFEESEQGQIFKEEVEDFLKLVDEQSSRGELDEELAQCLINYNKNSEVV